MTTTSDYRVAAPTSADANDWRLIRPDGQPETEANRFLHLAGLRGIVSRSLRTYVYDLLCAFRWMRKTGRRVTEISAENLLDFVEYQRQTPSAATSTINRRLTVFQRFIHFAAGKPPLVPDWQSPGVVFFRRGRRSSAVRVRVCHRLVTPLSDTDALTFFRTLRTARDRAITLLMWAEGLRSGEILNLGLEDVDFQNMSIKVFGKGRKERMLPLEETVARAMLHYLSCERPARSSPRFFVVLKGPRRGQPMTYVGLHRVFRYHRVTSGVHKANAHRFRHTFGANMTKCRMPLAVLARMMGHSSPQTTMRYINLNDQEVRQQYEAAINMLGNGGVFSVLSSPADA